MSIQELQTQLNSQDKSVRHNALVQLLQLASHEAYGVLMFAANNHYSPETRHEAKKASLLLQKKLFATDDPQQKEQELTEQDREIIKKLKSEEVQLKKEALVAIEESRKPELLGLLVQYMHRERVPELCAIAFQACARSYGNDSFSHIVSFLRSGNEYLRSEAIKAISILHHHDVIPILLRFTRDPSKEVQIASLQALSALETEKLVKAMAILSQKSGGLNKDAIIFVVAKLSLKEGFALLAGFLNDEQADIRERAKNAIEYLEKKGVWLSTEKPSLPTEPQVVAQVSSLATEEREEPEAMIAESDDISAAPSEATDISSEATDISSEADELAELTEKEEKEKKVLFNKISGQDQNTVIPALFEINQRGWFDILFEIQPSIIERNNTKILATYIMVLGQSADVRHRDFLLDCLEHADGRVQANAIESLHRLGFSAREVASQEQLQQQTLSSIREKIVPFVQSKHDRAKTNALIFLHSSGLVNTVEELKSMLLSRRENRQLSAIFAISDLFDPQFIPLLDIPMDSPNPKVTGKAMDTLRMFVLEEHESAVDLARKWKILDELQLVVEDEEPEKDAMSEEEKEAESMDSLLSDLEKSKDKNDNKPESKKGDKNVANNGNKAKKGEKDGMSKIKTFLHSLNNIFNKK